MNDSRRLGRGLAALLGDDPDLAIAEGIHERPDGGGHGEGAHEGGGEHDLVHRDLMISVDEIIENPFQPRREFGEAEIASLAESLREHDMLQPVLVRRVNDRWQLISGERRLRAAVRAGWKKIPARVREADDRLVAELAIVENLQRKDLNAIEKALSFQRYLQEHQCTQEDLGRRIKIDRSTIANLMRLLELPDSIQRMVREGTLSGGHARALLPLGDPREQLEFAEKVLSEQLSVRATEEGVQERIAQHDGGEPKRSTPKTKIRTGPTAVIEQELRQALGIKVDVRALGPGRGRVTLQFRNHEEFARIRRAILDGATNTAVARAS